MLSTPLREVVGTLRVRLTLWNTAVVLSLVLLTLFGVREGLRLTIRHESDALLRETRDEIWRILGKKPFNWDLAEVELDDMAEARAPHRFFVQIFNEDGSIYWQSRNQPTLDLDEVEFPERIPLTYQHYRLLQRRLDIPGMPALRVRIGMSPEVQRQDLDHLTNILIGACAITLLVAPLGGYLLAGRATRPVAKIINTTSRLHPSSLHERLPIRGTGDELDRLSQTINGFLDRIAAYIAQNQEFTANAAHELRSPLAAIQSSLEVALNVDRTNEEYREILVVVLEECENLRTLVNQLLLLAESDAGRLQLDAAPVRIDQIIQKSVEMFRGVAEAAEVSLRVEKLEPILLTGNAARLRQVVNNLLDNAIKYTPRPGWVKVTLRLAEPGTAVLEVADSGTGISAEDLPHIFERFFRADRARVRERPTRGTGLGLAICRSIVQAHGGKIRVESTPNAGTCFTVELAQARSCPPESQEPSESLPAVASS